MTQAGILLHQPSQGKNRNFCTGRFQLSRGRRVGDGTRLWATARFADAEAMVAWLLVDLNRHWNGSALLFGV